MKSIAGYIVVALVAYAVFLMATFPADRAYHVLQAKLPPGVKLYELHGSVWDGRAAAAQIGQYRLAPLRWEYRPAGLLSGRLDVKVSFQADHSRASAVVGVYRDGDVHLSGVDIDTAADELMEAFRVPIIRLEGQVSAKLADMTVESHRLKALDGTVTWSGARVSQPRKFVLGGLVAKFTTKGGVINGTLRDKGGPLQVRGQVTLKPDGSYQLNATLENRDANQPDLTRFLGRLGRAGPGGRVTVTYSGKLPPLPVGS